LRALAVTVAAGWAFLGVMVVLVQAHNSFDPGTHGWFAIELALAAGWLLSAVSAARRAVTEHSTSFTWLATGAVLMATAEVFRALAFVEDPKWQFASTGIQLVVAALVLVNAAQDLAVLISAESRLVHSLSGAVWDTERQMSEDDRTEATRRHDARAILAALRTASLVLDRYDETLDHATRTELLRSFGNELSRLEQMVDRRTLEPLEVFALDSVVGPAVRSVPRTVVVGELPAVKVYGRALEFRGLVENIVSVLSRRSISGEVAVRVGRSTSGVQVICEAAARPENVSVGDADASARKLRIQVARRMMREQGGDVVVSDSWDGKTSVSLWLRPAPDTSPVGATAATAPTSDGSNRRLPSFSLGTVS
jgi:hypothetical protein